MGFMKSRDQGTYFLLEEHIDRLYRSAAAIRLSVPFDKDVLMEKLELLREMNNVKEDAILYLQVTRGSFPRNHAFPAENRPNLYAYIREMPRKIREIENGVRTILTRDVRWEYCYIKSLNLLPNVLAKQEATERGAFEAIFYRDGDIFPCQRRKSLHPPSDRAHFKRHYPHESERILRFISHSIRRRSVFHRRYCPSG